MRGAWGVWSTSLLSVVLLARPATAQTEEEDSWLRLSAPAGCPDRTSIEARVVELLGRSVPSPAELDVRAVITFDAPDWEVDVTLAAGDARGTRRVRAATCADVADFVAITVVLAIDPGHAAVEPEPAPVGPFPEAPVAEPMASAEAEAAPAAPLAVSRVPRSRRFFLAAGAEGLVGTLPSVRVGPTASAGAQLGSFLLALGGSYFPPLGEGADIAANPIALSLVHARARSCLSFGARSLSGGPCLHVDVGAMMADEAVTGGRRATELYVALGGGARGVLRLSPHVSLVAQAGVAVPLTQPRFVLSDGTLVHQPRLGGTASLELSLNWPGVTKTDAPDTE